MSSARILTAAPAASPPLTYLAARYSRRAEMQAYAADLAQLGLGRVEARWLTGEHDWDGSQAEGAELAAAQRYALDDLADLGRSRVVVVFTEQPVMAPAREALAAELVAELRAGAEPEAVVQRVLAIGRNRGGRHVEYGLALASHLTKPKRQHVVVCGPAENVFHTLPMVPRFATWQDVVVHLTELRDATRSADIRQKLLS